MNKRLIPSGEVEVEIRVSNSRFIATAAPVFSVAEAKEFITKIKERYSDASHNVPTFLIGHGASVTAHSSDDGEPSGTAGRPALAVLQGSGLGDIAVVITRYFGGTKLGTGGLVRAYSDAMRAVIEKLPRAQKVSTKTLMLAVTYSQFEQAKLLIENHRGKISDEDFGVDVVIVAQFRDEDIDSFNNALQALTNGQVSADIMSEDANTIMQLD